MQWFHRRKASNENLSMKRLLKRRKREGEREEEKRRALKAAIKSFETDIEEYSLLLKKKRI